MLHPIIVIITERLAIVKDVRGKDAYFDDDNESQVRIDIVGILLSYHYNSADYDGDARDDKL